jgi:hypothetical protein
VALFAVAFALTECPAEDGEFAVTALNPEDCSTFYLCNAGEPILHACPENLEYNEELGVCDWAENAKCVATKAKA